MAKAMTSYRRVAGDIEEASLIERLLQEELNKDFDTLKGNVSELHKRTSQVAKWSGIVADLKTAAPRDEATALPSLPNPAKVVHDALTAPETQKSAGPDTARATRSRTSSATPS